ncbi:PaaI family thioesterase [Starkeya sp. ORNL1]|uniref:PaaI family thioesterase n=1 Tax=Starkeya sp. ORNL1 TaxID=2709380 RepID=UPI001464836D|nr:PaaI family thioesterase [Starkeya sp. ORNL1]QJP12573.1 PaaI family thioesterase [Starkeya sp. ORNL1]
MTADELQAYLVTEFPQAFGPGQAHRVEAAGEGAALVRLEADDQHLRPGGTVSGPALMGLADIAAYVAILTAIGEVPLAVTTSFSINFLRKPAPGAVLAEARLLKLGKRLAVCEVDLRADGGDELCAHAVATYSIPGSGT